MPSQSLSARRAWIEIDIITAFFAPVQSLSARRAWIEIACQGEALRGVHVALRKESVDRNSKDPISSTSDIVALRKESVDRNTAAFLVATPAVLSLSARRAWIEISTGKCR